ALPIFKMVQDPPPAGPAEKDSRRLHRFIHTSMRAGRLQMADQKPSRIARSDLAAASRSAALGSAPVSSTRSTASEMKPRMSFHAGMLGSNTRRSRLADRKSTR